MTRFIHTADLQIGKPFAGIEETPDPQKRVTVQQERIAVLDRIGAAAKECGAEFVLIAGDAFDSSRVTRATVSLACAAIGRIGVPVLVIPGNHDHGGPGSLWEQPFFKSEQSSLAPNLRVLLDPVPVELPSAALFPCPLVRRHESADATAWLREIGAGWERFGEKPRIVLAHGSIMGFGAEPDDEEASSEWVNRIDLGRLPGAEIDYVALGDWHGTKEAGDKAWYSGTPEPDRFPKGGDHDPGNILAVCAERGAAPRVERVRTQRIGWHRKEMAFSSDGDLDRFDREVKELLGDRVGLDLLRLELSGALGIEAAARLGERLDALRARLLRVKLLDRTTVLPTDQEIDALTMRVQDPLISRVAGQLIDRAKNAGDDETRSIAGAALRELYALCGNQP
jgi:DNA repair exonuclease SbcCD nuclease subunit